MDRTGDGGDQPPTGTIASSPFAVDKVAFSLGAVELNVLLRPTSLTLEVPMKRFVLTLLLLSVSTAFLGGCHTVAGVGKDVKAAGEEVQEASGKN